MLYALHVNTKITLLTKFFFLNLIMARCIWCFCPRRKQWEDQKQKLRWTKIWTSSRTCKLGTWKRSTHRQTLHKKQERTMFKCTVHFSWACVTWGTQTVEDDWVFTEQGASVSQAPAAATKKETISRLFGMAGGANDAVSAYTQLRQTLEVSGHGMPTSLDTMIQWFLSRETFRPSSRRFIVGAKIGGNLVARRLAKSHILERVHSTISGGMNFPQSNTGYEPNSELDMFGMFVPIVDFTQNDEDGNSHMSDIPLQLPARANVASDNSALVTISPAEGDLMRNVPSLHPTTSQTGSIPRQLQCPSTYPQGSPAVLGPQESLQLVTQRHEKLWNISAKRLNMPCSIKKKKNFQLSLISMKRLHGKIMSVRWQEIVTRPIIMCKCKFDSSNKIHTRDFPRKQRELSSRFSQEANQALEDQRDNLLTEVTSEVWRRYEQVHDLRRKLSLQALHAEDVTQQQSQEYAGSQQHLTRLVQETQQYREMFEESRSAQSAAGPEIDRIRHRGEELLRAVRRRNMKEQNWSSIMRNRADLESHKSRTSEGQQVTRELHSENMQLQASALEPDPTQDFVIQDWMFGMNRQEAAVECQKAETKSLQRDFESTQDSLNNWEEVNLTSVPGVYVVNSVGTSTSSGSRILEPAITRLLQSEGDLELVKLREHSMPIAAPNTPVAVHNSFPTTSLPIESTEATGTDPDYGGPKKREAEQMTVDQWLHPTEFRSWQISFKSEVSQSSQCPRAAKDWIGEVEDAESIDSHFLSIFDRRNHCGTSRLWMSGKFDRELRETSHHSRRQSSIRDHLQAEKLLGWSTTSSKLVATMKPPWTSEIHRMSNFEKKRLISRLRHNVGRSIISSHWQIHWQHIGEFVQDATWKVGRVDIFVASPRSRNNIRRQERLSFMAQRHLEQQINDSYFKARNRDEGRPAMEAPSKGKAKGKGKETAKNNSERGDCTPWTTKGQCWFGDSCAFKHEPNKKGKGKGRPHRNSKGDRKGSW